MNKIRNIICLLGLSLMVILTGCSEPDDEIKSIDYARLFSPTNFKARVVNKTQILMTWTASPKAESYTIEVYANGDLNFEGTPVKVIDGIESSPYTVLGLDGETDYSVRIQAVAANIPESKWVEATISTDAEQIFESVKDEDLTANSVTLRWPAGEVATQIILTPGDITHTVTAAEIAAGAVTIDGLTGETKYTAKLMNGSKTRGTMAFTTKIDLGDAIAVYEGDDLVAKLNEAKEGDSFVIISGTFDLGEYAVTKALSIAGYEAGNKPTVKGNFLFKEKVGSFNLTNLIVDGTGETENRSYFIVADPAAIVGDVNIVNCEISNFKSGFISNSSSGTAQFGNVLVSGCVVTNIEGNGGDGFDFRSGTGGKITSLTVENSTFNKGFRAFLRMQLTSDVKFKNCTFYKISIVDNSNNSGLFRSSTGGTLEVSNCLFVETGVANPSNVQSGNWCRNSGNMKATTSYSNNVYYNCNNLWVGLYTDPSQCSATSENPEFADAAKGDFTVGNILVNAGDPRWLP